MNKTKRSAVEKAISLKFLYGLQQNDDAAKR